MPVQILVFSANHVYIKVCLFTTSLAFRQRTAAVNGIDFKMRLIIYDVSLIIAHPGGFTTGTAASMALCLVLILSAVSVIDH